MGKGSKRRPRLIDRDRFDSNWDNVFKREKENMEKNRYKRKQRNNERN